MHRTQTERQALAHRLLGTPSEPSPIDVGWLKARFGIEGSHIKRWREQGIPAARVDDLEAAIQEIADTTKEPQPAWAGAMEKRLRLEMRLNRALIEADVTPDEIERMRAELHAETPVERPPAATVSVRGQRPLDKSRGTRR